MIVDEALVESMDPWLMNEVMQAYRACMKLRKANTYCNCAACEIVKYLNRRTECTK